MGVSGSTIHLYSRPPSGLARRLINYRWLANCGKTKSIQMQLLTNFVNQVFSLNAANGRVAKPPLTYKEIEDVMSEMVWTRGIKKSSNCGGKDPYASSPPGVPQAQVLQTTAQRPENPGNTGNKRNGGSGKDNRTLQQRATNSKIPAEVSTLQEVAIIRHAGLPTCATDT